MKRSLAGDEPVIRGSSSAWSRLLRHPLGCAGAIIGAFVVAVALLSPWLTPNDPLTIYMPDKLLPPSLQYPLGTDQLGRCVFSRLMEGARSTLGLSFLVLVASAAVGISVGLLSGYAGGRADMLFMRLVDGLGALPELLIAIAVAGFLGPGLMNVMAAIACVKWIGYARLVRGIVLSEKQKEYVLASVVSGSGAWAVVRRHLLRQIAAPAAVMASLDAGRTILLISMLSFLGLGAQPPAPEWGAMLSDGRSYFQTQPQLMVYPGLCIMVVVLACNLLSDGLRDISDVRGR